MAKTTAAQRILRENCLRLRGEMRQGEVAAKATRAGFKIDQKTVSRIEDLDHNNATLHKIEAVAAGLGVQPWKLLLPSGVSQLPEAAPQKVSQIISIANKLNEDGLTALLFSAELIELSDKYLVKPKSKPQQ